VPTPTAATVHQVPSLQANASSAHYRRCWDLLRWERIRCLRHRDGYGHWGYRDRDRDRDRDHGPYHHDVTG
jgi:hypothetical protein